ncbi:MAG: alpha-2-macroglobulin family protein [Nakamurella sp.]
MDSSRISRRLRTFGITAGALTALTTLVVGIAVTSSSSSVGDPVVGTQQEQPRSHQGALATDGTPPTEPRTVEQIGLALRDGRATRPAGQTKVASGTPLDAGQVDTIVDRLPPLVGAAALQEQFRWPVQSLTTPERGTTVAPELPPGGDPAEPPSPKGPLQVLRMQPQGAVAVAPFISITFDQPMVPIATVTDQAQQNIPATMSPQVKGTWRWIGTSTLRFAATESVDRLPMATKFTVTVPVGTKSITGNALAQTATATFTTPAPTVRSFTPQGEGLDLDPVFVAVFDQRVDAAAVLSKFTLTADGAARPVRGAGAAEIAADPAAAKAVAAAPRGQSVAFMATAPLPADAAFTATFGAGTPSAEGSIVSSKPATFTGRTYPAMTMTKGICSDRQCEASSPLVLQFSNPIDTTAFDPATVHVTPEVPGGASITASGNLIVVQGSTLPAVEYTVTVDAGLLDTHGQQLAQAAITKARMTAAGRRLDPFPQALLTVDPLAKASTITVNTVNRQEFRERVFRVSTADFAAFRSLYRSTAESQTWNGIGAIPSWPVLQDRVIRPTQDANKLISTPLDLTDPLSGDGGTDNVVVLLEPTGQESFGNDSQWQNRPTMAWVQRTGLALDAISDRSVLRAWVTSFEDGSPLGDVTVGPLGTDGAPVPGGSVQTDANGIAAIALTANPATALIARRGDQTALLAGNLYDGSWRTGERHDQLVWFVNDDRQTYRPGETISVKGWVRHQADDVSTALSLPTGSVKYTVTDGHGVSLRTGTVKLSKQGGFDFAVEIPAGANLGEASVMLHLVGASQQENDQYHQFRIADFTTPTFQVDAHAISSAPHVLGEAVDIDADATYYAGGGVGDAPVQWQVRTATASYAPPGWSGYTYGRWQPWWQSDAAMSLSIGSNAYGSYRYDSSSYGSDYGPGSYYPGDYCCGPNPADDQKVEKHAGTTDADGANHLQVSVGDLEKELGKDSVGMPVTVTAQAEVTDVDRTAIAGTTDLLIHPASYYVGLAGDDTFVKQGQDLVIRTITTDIDGTPTAGRPVRVVAALVTTTWAGGKSTETEGTAQTCTLTSTTDAANCTFRPATPGTYRITATVTDEKGRSSRTVLTRWVAGASGAEAGTVQEQTLTVVPKADTYRPGQTAELLVQSPIPAGSGLATVVHNGIISTTRFTVTDGSAVVQLPVTEGWIPGVAVSIEVVGTTTDAAGARQTAYATGEVALKVSTVSRELKVTATPRAKTVAPGGSTKIDVGITDGSGGPAAGAEFELVVVDEAVLAVGGAVRPDPMGIFYGLRGSSLDTQYSRSGVLLSERDNQKSQSSAAAGTVGQASYAEESGAMASSSADSAGGVERATPAAAPLSAGKVAPNIGERTDFAPLAVFVPSATTDAAGHATVDVTLPDNLTRYRVLVFAVAGADRFGSAESTITAGLPLTVRSAGPTFLNFGDRFEFPMLVQNRTAEAIVADVVLQGSNLTVSGTGGRRVSIPANSRVEVRIPVAAEQAGTARVRMAVVDSANPTAGSADAVAIDVPVYTPATSESVATYGQLDSGGVVRQPVSKPTDVFGQFGSLQISTSSTALAELTDAVLSILDYEYESSDALAGRIIAIASLGDVLKAFSAPGLPSPEQLRARVEADLEDLVAMQNTDGGFPYWKKGEPNDAFNSIQATQALVVAKNHGYSVPAAGLRRSLKFLTAIQRHYPPRASQTTKDTLRSFALAVRALAGDRDSSDAEALFAARGPALSMDAVAWLLPVVSSADVKAELMRRIQNAAVDDAGAVTITTRVVADAWTTLQSDTRTDGLVLDALLTVDPDSDLIPKIVKGLMGTRIAGRWSGMQENSVILLALRHYYDTCDSATPDFVARIWVGGRFAGEHDYAGRTTDRVSVDVPTAQLLVASGADVTLQNEGTGRLYYRIGITTAPKDLTATPLDRGFVVSRTYRAVDDPADVRRDAQGVWHVKTGARVEVRLELVSRSARPHVALIDPLPAGLQSLNPALATTAKDLDPKKAADAAPTSWYGTWYDHQNLRDDRAEAFAQWLQGGVYSYSYLTLAKVPGTFTAPPARAEQVYAPETFGRSGSDKVVVEG